MNPLACSLLISILAVRSGAYSHTEHASGKPTLSALSKYGGQVLSRNGGVEMVPVAEGWFPMGEDSWPDNKRHQVYLSTYWISVTPVTVGQFRTFCEKAPYAYDWAKNKPKWGWVNDHPMVNVSWKQCSDFCKWAGGALPTEAQWEKAARGPNAYTWPWGNRWDGTRLQWSEGGVYSGAGGTASVYAHTSGVSPYGCLEMAGNIWQRCSDWYAPDLASENLPDHDPMGPPLGKLHVCRGGSWVNINTPNFWTYYRNGGPIEEASDGFGFRLMIPQETSKADSLPQRKVPPPVEK